MENNLDCHPLGSNADVLTIKVIFELTGDTTMQQDKLTSRRTVSASLVVIIMINGSCSVNICMIVTTTVSFISTILGTLPKLLVTSLT